MINCLIIHSEYIQDSGCFVPSDAQSLQSAKLQLKSMLAMQCSLVLLHSSGQTTATTYGSLHFGGISMSLKLTATISSGDQYDLSKYTFTEDWTNAYANT